MLYFIPHIWVCLKVFFLFVTILKTILYTQITYIQMNNAGLKRIVQKIRAAYPRLKINIRADGGFSCPAFYQLADDHNPGFVMGLPGNEVLKRRVKRAEKTVRHSVCVSGYKTSTFLQPYLSGQKLAQAWECYTKVESTSKGLNTRHIVSNLPGKDARTIYFGIYVKRGETSEKRIREVKNMCFSDRLSNHNFWANFLRLLISSLVYEMFLYLKSAISKTTVREAKKWVLPQKVCLSGRFSTVHFRHCLS